MSLFYYEIEHFNILTVIGLSDEDFATLHGMSYSFEIVTTQNVTTESGTTFFNIIPASGLQGKMVIRSGTESNIDLTRYDLFKAHFPLISVDPMVLSDSNVDNYYLVSNTTDRKVGTRTRNLGNYGLYMQTWFEYNNTSVASRNTLTPIGKAHPFTSSAQNPNVFEIGFLTCNSDRTQYGWIEIVCGDGNTGNIIVRQARFTFGNENATMVAYFTGLEPVIEVNDPFGKGGYTEEDGGDGDFRDNGENVADPDIPDIDAVSTGFITIFNPTISELNSLASYMWSTLDITTFKKVFANPMDCILGLSILPKIVPAGSSSTVLVGNISTGVSMTKAARQYVKYDCGSLKIKRFSNSFLDYEPYTKIYLYLPFIGIHEISTDDVMNKTIHIKYTIDILSGACVAFVIVDGTTLYSFIGQCAASVPVTGQDWSTMINGVLGAVSSIASTVSGAITGNVGQAIQGLASTAQHVMNSKPNVQHSGNMGGMGGMLGIKYPYVIIERPAQAIPEDQNEFVGYPSFVTKTLGDLSGYNEIYSIHLENIPATNSELNEIESILKSGVIF